MPITVLNKGYKKPSNPTTGDVFFKAMEEDIQLMNDHVHDGVTGAVTPSPQLALAIASWVLVPATTIGAYRQLVTLPVGFTYDQTQLSFRYSTGEVVYPSVEKVSANSFYVYTNDPTKAYVCVYG